jgi:hypothetical protein
MHSQLNRLGKQTTSLGSAYTKAADNADKERVHRRERSAVEGKGLEADCG